jgi:aminoglycoside phosphotransferase (APT) family kinase protein
VSVEALPSVEDQDYDVAFVQDSEHRRWVVRAPRTEAAGARMDQSVTLLQMLARRVPFAIPVPRGFVELKGGGRAMVYPFLPGHNLAFEELPGGPGPAADLGRCLASLHNTDVRLFDEAGMPTYDTDSYRTRRLAELDRAAESGRVPTALLARWERALEDVGLWRFAPTPVHGDLTGDHVLAVFEDYSDASTGRIRGITGWENAKVADPADDFAAVVNECDPATIETVAEAYAHARVERPDPNLLVRARLAAELGVLAELMRADARGDEAAVEGLSTRLRRLDDEVHAEDPADDYRRTSLTPVALRARAMPPPIVEEDEDEDDGVAFDLSEPDGDRDSSSVDDTSDDPPEEPPTQASGAHVWTGGPEEDDHDARGDGDEGDAAVDRSESAAEDLSPEDEVAWTPRSLAPDSPAVVGLAEDDSDDADDDPDTGHRPGEVARTGSHVAVPDATDADEEEDAAPQPDVDGADVTDRERQREER